MGSPFEFNVSEQKQKLNQGVLAFGEHPFENSTWGKSFIPKTILGGNGFELIDIKYIKPESLICKLVCIKTNHKEDVIVKHVSKNIFEVKIFV